MCPTRTSERAQSSSSPLLDVRQSTTINKCIIYWEDVQSAARERERVENEPEISSWQKQQRVLGAKGTRGRAQLACSPQMLSSTWQTKADLSDCPGFYLTTDNIHRLNPWPPLSLLPLSYFLQKGREGSTFVSAAALPGRQNLFSLS